MPFVTSAYEWLRDFAQSPILLEYAKLGADVLKGVAWPFALVFVVLLFKREIRPLIDRIIKLGPGGIELGPREAAKQAQAETVEPDALQQANGAQLKELPGKSRSEALRQLELKLKENLSDLVAKGKVGAGDQVDFLINELAGTRLVALFDRVYLMIFGSQIRGLIHLNQFGTATLEDARQLYAEAKAADLDFYGNYTFEQWLGFIKDNDLIGVSDDSVSITPIGRDFVQYLTVTGRVLEKRG